MAHSQEPWTFHRTIEKNGDPMDEFEIVDAEGNEIGLAYHLEDVALMTASPELLFACELAIDLLPPSIARRRCSLAIERARPRRQ